MYSGITQGLFKVVNLQKKPGLLTYTVELNDSLIKDLKIGDSVAIDGVCETVTRIEENKVTFDAMAETLAKTTLDNLQVGSKVSVERSLRMGDENGGHEVAGHVFEKGTVYAVNISENNVNLVIQCSPICSQYIFEKGFVAVDGSSLTVANVDKDKHTFTVYLIPETLRLTNFKYKKIGDKVNIEVDSKAVIITEQIKKQFDGISARLAKIEAKLQSL